MEIRYEGKGRWKESSENNFKALITSWKSVCGWAASCMLPISQAYFIFYYFFLYFCISEWKAVVLLCAVIRNSVFMFGATCSSSVLIKKLIVLEWCFGHAPSTQLFLSSAVLAWQMTSKCRASTRLCFCAIYTHALSSQIQKNTIM